MREMSLPAPQVITKKFGAKSNIRGALELILTWLCIAAAVLVTSYLGTWAAVPGLLLLAGLQHRLFTIYHDAFHGCLVSNVDLGHFLGKLFAAYPSLTRYDNVRKRHLDHHMHAASIEDPERVSHCSSWQELLPMMYQIPWALSRAVFGKAPFEREFNKVLAQRTEVPFALSVREGLSIVVVMIVVIAILGLLCWSIGRSFLWALIYPLGLVLIAMPIMVLRQWTEHYNQDDKTVDEKYTYVRSNLLERFWFSPMNFNYHGAHHFYPWISHHNLPYLHAHLMELGVSIKERPSYMGIVMTLPWRAA